MTNVIDLPVLTTLDLNADKILSNLDGKLKGFVLIGYDLNDDLFYSSTYGNKAKMLWMIENFKLDLMDDDYD